MNPFNLILVYPITNVLLAVYHVLLALHVPYSLGFAIVVLTILIRIILYPLISSQIKASKKMQEISGHVSRLKEKHKGDSKTLQAETMKLYKEHGVNPAAGCLPLLIQIPIIWGLYSVLQEVVRIAPNQVVAQINKIVYFSSLHLTKPWDPYFFGFSLAQNPSKLISTVGPLILLVPALTGILQFVQSKMMIPQSLEENKNNKEKKDDFATAFQSQSVYIFPVMIGFLSYTFPLGLSLYWNTFTIFGIIQQYKISGLGGLARKKK